jgi:imidazolonepropionase-like amidohydrolase
MHVHTTSCRTDSFPLFLALGVTTIRDCAGDPAHILAMRDSVAAGEVTGPRMFSMGATLDGSPATWAVPPNPAQLYELHDEAEARAAAERLLDMGVDGLKLYARLPPDLVAAVTSVAKDRVPTTGHLSRTTATEAVERGITCLEHVHAGIYQDVVRPEDRHAPESGNGVMPNYWNWLAKGWARADLSAEHVRRFVDLLVERDTSLCATQVMITGGLLTEEAAEEPGLVYLPAHMRERHDPENARRYWLERRRAAAEAGQPVDFDAGEVQAARSNQLQFIKMAADAGVRLVIGTDVGGATMQVPGFSMHREMALHEEAGMSPAEVLHAATGAAAEALWKDADLGTIAPGKLADVIVVEGDALADLSAVRNVVTVLRDGVPFEAAALLDEAREVAAAASG